jgi:cold shock CspA family protein
MERKSGVIRSWHESRGFGILRVGAESSLEKYFLHVSNIRTGTATPQVSWSVEFEVSDKPVKEGNLLQTIRAHIIIAQPKQSEPAQAQTDSSKGEGSAL